MKVILEFESIEKMYLWAKEISDKYKEETKLSGKLVEDLDMPTRICNALRKHGITHISQLTDLMNGNPIVTKKGRWNYDLQQNIYEDSFIIHSMSELTKLKGIMDKSLQMIELSLNDYYAKQ